jgi:hypothetical protein
MVWVATNSFLARETRGRTLPGTLQTISKLWIGIDGKASADEQVYFESADNTVPPPAGALDVF